MKKTHLFKDLLALTLFGLAFIGTSANAAAIKNPIAIFAGLDKITGTITTFEINVNQTKRFGSLNITPRVCYSRPLTEEPKTTAFLEIDENRLDGTRQRIFTGWMLAQSPGLNALEHPVYDIWLTGCRNPNAPKDPADTLPPLDDNKKKPAAN